MLTWIRGYQKETYPAFGEIITSFAENHVNRMFGKSHPQ